MAKARSRYPACIAMSAGVQISSRQALELLQQTAHLLKSCKAARARLAIAEYPRLTPRNGKYDPESHAKRTEFETKLLAIKP
jgi:hypothetical protein